MNEKKFRETEAKYKELKEKHAKREISTEEVKEQLKHLMVQDETGTYWMLGGKTGKWYRHDGAQWQETDPYEIINAMKEVEEAEEVPMELDASDQLSEEQEEKQEFAQEEEQEEVQEEAQEEKNPFDSAEVDAADTGNLSYPSFATGAPGTDDGSEEEEVESLDSVGTIEVGDTMAKESAGGPYAAESPYSTVTADVSSSPFKVETGEAAETDDGDIRVGSDSYDSESAGPLPGADRAGIDAGSVEDSTYGSFDTMGTYEIDTTSAEASDEEILIEKGDFADEDEALGTKMESLGSDAAAGKRIVDTRKFEYESSEEEEEEPLFPRKPMAAEAPVKPMAPAPEPQDYISCGVCKSRIPPFAIHCTFCGAHQKTLKQPTSLKSIKEESELLVKSIRIIPFLFFLGGLGLIVGVILGATFGVVKDFLSGLSTQLPMMLSETRGGIAGGLIFAAIGGIGGFILSAILSTILAGVYNFAAFIFGGIRFKVKR